jgi:hypothetical protein
MPRELTAQVKEKLAHGYYPTAVFSAWEVLLTQAKNNDDLVDNSDVQVVRRLTSEEESTTSRSRDTG